MRLIVSLLALASLVVPASAQSLTYRDLRFNGFLTVLDLGRGPVLILSGMGQARDVIQYIGGTQAQVGLTFGDVWVYDGNACRAGHVYAIHNSAGFYEACFRLDHPMQWGPLVHVPAPDSMGLQVRGEYTSYSLSVCERLPGWGDNGAGACPDGLPDGCTLSRGAQFWSITLGISG